MNSSHCTFHATGERMRSIAESGVRGVWGGGGIMEGHHQAVSMGTLLIPPPRRPTRLPPLEWGLRELRPCHPVLAVVAAVMVCQRRRLDTGDIAFPQHHLPAASEPVHKEPLALHQKGVLNRRTLVPPLGTLQHVASWTLPASHLRSSTGKGGCPTALTQLLLLG